MIRGSTYIMKLKDLEVYNRLCKLNGITPTWEGLKAYADRMQQEREIKEGKECGSCLSQKRC